MCIRDSSKDENVDPIGACIGPKGMRVGNIIDELGGEKIDVVKYSEDPAKFIAEALSLSLIHIYSKASLDCLYFIILLCGNHENGMNCFLIFFGEIMESA